MIEPILSVSDCIALINQTLEYAYPSVVVEGEVASFKVSKDKYVFFDLKDETGVLGCFMMVYQLRTVIEDGMKVRVQAQPRLTDWGKFSLIIRDIQLVGEGSIKRSNELLRAKLQAEGLFDPGRKRLLPVMPECVGVIASIESAGYADFLKVLGGRWGGVTVVAADVQVQGSGAGQQIIAALEHFNASPESVEVVLLIRGGGSAEDLAVFNEEPLVRAIAASRIVTLVGVGHETDTSLCDLAADVRAATPSNAAQLLVPERQAFAEGLAHKERRMKASFELRLKHQNDLVRGATEALLRRIDHLLKTQQQRVDYTMRLLRQLNPKAPLKHGYALVRQRNNRLIPGDARGIHLGSEITIELESAILDAGVVNVRKK